MRAMTRFLNLSLTDKFLAFRLLMLLGFYRWQVLTVPFKRWVKPVGKIGQQVDETPSPTHRAMLRKLLSGIPLISKKTPWRSNCLAQALTAAHILRKKQIAYTLYLGVNTNQPQSLSAHAWLQVGKLILTGNEQLSQYKVATIIGYQPKGSQAS
jgi:hypothetical protein